MGHTEEGLEAALVAVIRAEMAAQGISQVELAERTEVSRIAMSRYMRGLRTMPVDVYLRISWELGMQPQDLMRQAEVRSSR